MGVCGDHVLFKLSKLYHAMYINDKESIAASLPTRYDILSNHLHCLSNSVINALMVPVSIILPTIPRQTGIATLKYPDLKSDSFSRLSDRHHPTPVAK